MTSLQLKPGHKVKIDDFDPSSTDGFQGGKEAALNAVRELVKELETLQETLYAEHKHKVLIILQAMDTGGKDGTIRRVFEGVNPQGVRVASFKPPTPVELDHDYMWRIHPQAPAKGEIVIFNRSHYEEVLVARVRKLVPEDTWRKRYDQINDFERLLSEEGTLICKFFLHISRDEQRKRLRQRLDDKTKQWKYDPTDLQDRAKWSEYMQAYEDVLNKTTTDYAPWVVVPANHKWYRDWVVAKSIVDALRSLHLEYPTPSFDVDAARRDFERAA